MHRLIVVAFACVLVASCDRFPDNGLQIAGMLPLTNDCTADPSSAERQAFGLWDVQNPDTQEGTIQRNVIYIVSPLLESYIVSVATDIQAEQNNLQVNQLEVTLQTPDGVAIALPEGFPNPYTVTASANLPAAEEDSFSAASAITVAIPSEYAQPVYDAVTAARFDQVVVVLRAIGTTMGGFTQKSGPFYWPVTLCMGCLNLCPEEQDVAELTDEQINEIRSACVPGQDGYPYCPFRIPNE